MKHLEACNYHIMHYAGHGQYNKDEPEKSSLLFWEKNNGQKTITHLSNNILKNTLCFKGYDLRLMYLSCCFGTATSDANTLLGRDFLGIADGLIQVGVPSVLGFRWPVSDSGAQELALAFYESLFEQRDLDTALFHARCKISGDEDGLDSGDWLSPILIVQG